MRVHGIQLKLSGLPAERDLRFQAFQSSEFHERYGNRRRSSGMEREI